ncbi:MAG: IS1182 family transposase [Deltaproteobacteria bacterium]|nr:IS1182 family transposase [Deltaproteobacteria bacterium]
MAYRCGDRFQLGLFPPSIEDYVAPTDPVRAYDAFVEVLDFNALGIEIDPNQVGNPEYDPKAMLKLFVYGYSYGIKSSRKLERETYHNLSFIWLMGGLKPDHKTISEFRRKNKGALKKVLRQCARMCLRLGLIAGNVLFVDGSKLRANASRGQTHDQAYYEQLLSEIDGRIEQLVEECEKIDETEQAQSSWVEMEEELAQKKQLKDRVQEALRALRETEREKINLTDPDCAIMRSIQGSHASYNVQSVVDEKNGLIVHAEAVSETSDLNQFARQIDQANEVLDKPCEVACADAGYADTEELQKIDGKQIKVIVPSQRQALHEEEGPFTKSRFRYDKEQDCYWCPQGHRLSYVGTDKGSGKRHYRITPRETCHGCIHYGQCTEAKSGRKIIRLPLEEVKERLEAQYEEPSSQEVYAKRKARVEHPFGHIKRNLKTDGFLLRGRTGVNAETSLLGTCFNLARMITILGVSGLIEKLMAFRVPAFG